MRRAATLAAVVFATGLLGAPIAGAQQNSADDPTVRAALTTVGPAAPGPADDLVLGGTVENTGDGPLGDVQAILRYSRTPLDDRADVRRVATDRDVRWGQRYIDFFQPLDDLLPGETAAFELEIPVDEIDFGDSGVYAVGVDIRATTMDDNRLTLATLRTVVPWLDPDEVLPTVPVALLWPLATQPSLLPDGSLIDDDLAAELAGGGMLSELVAAPADAPVTWAVDPDLLATVETMAGGYTISSADGAVEGSGSDDAQAWLDAYGAATQGDQTLLLPYATPDLQALAGVDPALAAQTATGAFALTDERAADLESTADEPTAGDSAAGDSVAWLPGGTADGATLAALGAAGADTVVLSQDAVTPITAESFAAVAAGPGQIDAVLIDAGLDTAVKAGVATAVLTGDPAAGAVAARQGWLAETALLALAAVDSDRPPPALVAAAPYLLPADAELARTLISTWTTTPWMEPMALAGLPAPADRTVVTPDASAPALPAELTPDHVASVANLRDQTAHFAALLAETDPETVAALDTAAVRAASATWRTAPDAGAAYTETVTRLATAPLRQLEVLAPDQPTLSSNKGVFPLTIRNPLDVPVLVQLEFTSENPTRLSIADVPAQRVEAGEQLSVDVTAEAAVNGKVPVTVQLTTPDGAALGAPKRMVVNATDYGAIGWLVVGAAMALLAGTSTLRLLRERRRPAAGAAPGAASKAAPEARLSAEPEPLRETAR